MNLNTVRISITSFLAYSLMSAMISPLGIVSKPIADHYGVSLTVAMATFTYLALGNLLGCLLAIYLFDHVKFKLLIVGSAVIIGASVYAMYVVDLFSLLPLWLTAIGTCCGLSLSAAAVVITKTYSEKIRASMLLLNDSSYSMTGVLSTFLASLLIAKQLHFTSVYALALLVAIVITIVALFSEYSIGVDSNCKESAQVARIQDQPHSIHLISAAIFIYFLGFVTIYSWIPNYAQASMAASVEVSGQLLSRFFFGLFSGQVITFFIVLKFSIRKLLSIYTVLATLTTIGLWSVGTIELLQINMFVLGLISGGMYKVLLSYASLTVKNPGPKLVSYLVFSSALGTAVAPAVSSFVVEISSMAVVLLFTTFCYALTCVFFLCSIFIGQRERLF